jgi:hypothetical protein
MASEQSPDGQGLIQGTFQGRKEFQQVVRDAIAQAAREGWREMIWCDLTFEDWPLGERSVEANLQAWSETGRKFTILAQRYDVLSETHHRFVNWRRQWSHIIEARAVSSASPEEFPSVIYAERREIENGGWVMQRTQREWCKGVCGTEAWRRVQVREELQGWLAKSAPSFAATTLGL